MATADQISRTESARCDYQMRFYVSGKYALANLDSIAAGASYDPTASAELDAAMDRDSTQVVVDDTTGFPDAGTIIIGPGDDGESNEVVGYTSKTGTTFDGLTRGEFEVSDGLARITLNRPGRLNAFNAELAREWERVAETLQTLRDLLKKLEASTSQDTVEQAVAQLRDLAGADDALRPHQGMQTEMG